MHDSRTVIRPDRLSPPVMESAELQIQADMAYQFIQNVLGKEDIN